MSEKVYYKTRLRSKGQITIPNEVRAWLDLKEGDDLAFYVDENGQVIIGRLQFIPPDQAWFWTERWQQIEREAQADIDAGRIHRHANVNETIQALEKRANAGD